MAAMGSKERTLAFYHDDNDLLSEAVCLVLAEKGPARAVYNKKYTPIPQDLMEFNFYNDMPIFLDRDLALFDHFVIMEYLDERLPLPPLLPGYPIARAQYRSIMYRIKRDWYSLVKIILDCQEGETDAAKINKAADARKHLREYLVGDLKTLLSESTYFCGEQFSLLDCLLIPILVGMSSRLGIAEDTIPAQTLKVLKKYKDLVLSRTTVKAVYAERAEQ